MSISLNRDQVMALGDASRVAEPGDLFTREDGRWGEIEEILSATSVRVSLYVGKDPPDNEFGNIVRSLGITSPRDAQVDANFDILLDKIRVRRAVLGAQFSLRIDGRVRSAEVLRHLSNGFVEVKVPGFTGVRTHGSDLLDASKSDPSHWLILTPPTQPVTKS